MGVAFFVGTYIHEVQSWVRGVIVMDKTAFFTMPSGLYVVSAAADGLRAGCVINTAVQVTSAPAAHLDCREQGKCHVRRNRIG